MMYRLFTIIFLIFLPIACSDTDNAQIEQPDVPKMIVENFQPLGKIDSALDRSTIAHVNISDLNQDGLQDVIVCDVLNRSVSWIQQLPNGEFIESSILEDVGGAVHAEVVDIDFDGDNDVLVAVMGVILPSTVKSGQVIILENDGTNQFLPHVIADQIHRVTDVQAGDLDGDGDLDLSVAQFGYTQGAVEWFENVGDWKFDRHLLIERSGAIHAPIADIDQDGDLDIVSLLSQEWETVVAFVNNGKGEFMPEILHDVADADFSSSGITMADLDQDGDQDVVWTNGDAFVSIDYRPLPTHGLQWLENKGNREFTYHRIGQMDGAYSPTVVDFDQDGDLDIVTVAEFAFWEEQDAVSLRLWSQEDDGSFTPIDLANSPTHLVTCDIGDLNGDGNQDIVAGGMALYPPFDQIARVVTWSNGIQKNVVSRKDDSLPQPVLKALQAYSQTGEKAMVMHANGFDATSLYVQAMTEDPENPRWPYYIGLLEIAVGDSQTALQHFESALELNGNYKPLLTRIGEIYAGQDNDEKAIEYFTLADTTFAKIAHATIAVEEEDWGRALLIIGNEESAMANTLREYILAKQDGVEVQLVNAFDMGYQMKDPWKAEMDSQCVLAPLLVTQAQTALISQRISHAERLLRKAIELEPHNKDARLAISQILLSPSRVTPEFLQESINHLEIGLLADPKYVITRTKYGWALFLANRFDEARVVWKDVVKDEPLHGPALSNLAQLESQSQNYQEAYNYYRAAFLVPEDSPFSVSRHPTLRSGINFRFALVAKKVGRNDEAIDAMIRAVLLTPNDPAILFELGNTYLQQGKFQDALNNLNLAYQLQPNNPRLLTAIGYALFNTNEMQSSMEFLIKAVNLSPQYALAWYHLGNVQLTIGNQAAAIDSFNTALQLQPNFVQAAQALQQLQGN